MDEGSANMEYRKLGRLGVKVSPICLGTAFRGYWAGQSDEKTCIRVIETAVDHGINFIDCANFYFAGKCEALLGKALKGMKDERDNLVITSKVWSKIGDGPNDQGTSRYHIMREIERTLKRLQLDHIDLYLLHHFDESTPLDETLHAMSNLVEQGKIRYIGACNYTAAQVVEALWIGEKHQLAPMTCLQNQYNLLHRWEMEPELLGRCRQHGLGMMTFSPLAVGLLSGHFRKGRKPPEPSFWSKDAKRFRAVMTKQVDEIVATLIQAGKNLDKTPAQVAFAWILDHPEITAAITGPDRPEHVEEVCGGIGWTLPEEIREQLDTVSTPELPKRRT